MRPYLPAFAAALAAFAISAALPQPGAAQETPAPQATPADEDFTNSHLRAAQKIIDITRSGEPFDDILPALMSQTRLQFVRSSPALAREIEDVVSEVGLEMAAKRADLARTMQLIWARRFTEDELITLETFFQSETGKKFADQTPVISVLSLGAANQWESQLANEMLQVTRQRLRDKGVL